MNASEYQLATTYDRGRYYWHKQQYSDALHEFESVISDAPSHPQVFKALCMKARCLHCLKRYDEALLVFDEVISSLSKRKHECALNRSQAVLDQFDLELAIYLRGTVLFEMGRFSEAEEGFARLGDQPWSEPGPQYQMDAR